MKNFVSNGDVLNVTGPTGGLSAGDPYALGQIPLVAVTDIAEGEIGAAKRRGVYSLSVKGIDGGGDAAVSAGDQLYYVDADDPKINLKDTGVPFGKALEDVTAGATAVIEVMLDE